MYKFIFSIITIGFLFAGCKSASEKAVRPNKDQPHWVTKQPQSFDYYVGVGAVGKTDLNYREKAKKSALENLASEISVQISGESVLKTLETNSGFEQEYNKEITVSSAEQLEGFEMVDSYESDTEYWVYYRLSKSKYEEIKRARLNKALDLGKTLFKKSIDNHTSGNYYESYVLGIKSLESVSAHLDQPLKTDFEGKQIYFATEVMSYLQDLSKELFVKPSYATLDVVLGQSLNEDLVYFTVQDGNEKGVANIPLNIKYQAVFFKEFNIETKANGIAGVNIEKINQRKERQTITAEIDFNKIVESQTTNRIIRQLLNYTVSKSATINLNVAAPKVLIVSKEQSFDVAIKSKLSPSVRQTLIEKGFKIAKDYKDADFILTIHTNTNGSAAARGTFNCQLTGFIDVRSKMNNETVFSETIVPQNGLQLSKEKAADDVYLKADSYLKRRVIPKLANEFFSF